MDNITENNKLISEFMGNEKPNFAKINGASIDITNCAYSHSWDWLMPVVEKIESLENKLNNETKEEFRQFQKVLSLPIYSKIEAVYNVCIEFIKWYNKQNKK